MQRSPRVLAYKNVGIIITGIHNGYTPTFVTLKKTETNTATVGKQTMAVLLVLCSVYVLCSCMHVPKPKASATECLPFPYKAWTERLLKTSIIIRDLIGDLIVCVDVLTCPIGERLIGYDSFSIGKKAPK